MVRSRLGLKALGLCALVVGLMAFITSAAQAEAGAKWVLVKANGELVEVGNPSDALLPAIQIKEIEKLVDTGVAHAVLLTEVSKKKVEILCTTASLVNVRLELNGTVSLGKVDFGNCITKIGGVEQAVCVPHSKEAANGLIVTENGKGLLVLFKLEPSGVNDAVVRITPDVGETFVTIILGKEGVENECSIGEKLPVSGTLYLQDEALKTESVDHLIKEFVAGTDLWVLNKTAEHKSTIDGSALVALSGEHVGLKWAGLPN